MEKGTKLETGDQIVYIPTHANGDLNHPDCEFGFIMYSRGDAVACRFWNSDLDELRTKANSELCNIRDLEFFDSVDQEVVDSTIEWIARADEESK